ncbi:hypothetical protein SAMN05444342_4219 [Haladaptatus paucihalophilus DX253]|uniref:DUF8139 domain-containing protein n=1 Tax=Haladaptatus paucihalophilus DX253 TaxID=797209 RepID=A0A1M7BYM3_HALPU|nr:hypothetical protein SAMN05444342_4219 [Haladaptatus paucihalophilus DX253]
MNQFEKNDRVRIDIPDETDPGHESYHGREDRIIEVHQDNAGKVTGDERDNIDYLVKFDDGGSMYFRWRNLRPAFRDQWE